MHKSCNLVDVNGGKLRHIGCLDSSLAEDCGSCNQAYIIREKDSSGNHSTEKVEKEWQMVGESERKLVGYI